MGDLVGVSPRAATACSRVGVGSPLVCTRLSPHTRGITSTSVPCPEGPPCGREMCRYDCRSVVCHVYVSAICITRLLHVMISVLHIQRWVPPSPSMPDPHHSLHCWLATPEPTSSPHMLPLVDHRPSALTEVAQGGQWRAWVTHSLRYPAFLATRLCQMHTFDQPHTVRCQGVRWVYERGKGKKPLVMQRRLQ